jgi:CBS domain containing-hemolysin-like protein
MILLDFLIILILILLNGMFVAAEFSIIGIRPTRIDQLAAEGHNTAKRVQYILSNPAQVDRYIASAQLGITLASLGLGMYGEPVIAHLLEPRLHDWFGLTGNIVHTISFLVALSLITYLHVVIGEMIPKSMALQSSERVVFMLATPMLIMQTIFSWAITILNKIGVFVLWLLRVPPPTEGNRLHTPDELELIISDSVVGGLIEADEEQLLSNIFDFADLHVGKIMTPRPRIDAVSINISKEDLLEKMFTSIHTRLPVYEQDLDHILGIVHLKDLVHLYLDNTPYLLRELLHEVPFVPEGLAAEELLSRLKKRHVHMAIVIDEFGGTAGIVTLEDLLEEVVGEVRDEFDTEERDHITVVKPGHLSALGITRLDELKRYVDVTHDKHADDVDTIGGLMVANMPLPLHVGEELTVNDVKFRVEAIDGLTVERVAVFYNADADTPDTAH